MSFLSVSDVSGSLRLRYMNADLKRNANRLTAELASGRTSDVAAKLKGGLDRLGAVSRSVKMIDIYQMAGSELLTRASGLQSALQTVREITQSSGIKMLAAGTTPTDMVTSAGANAAFDGLKSVVGALNTRLAGRSLFAGRATDRPALVSAGAMLNDLQALTAAANTAAQVAVIVDTYFNQPGAGFDSSAYLGAQTSSGPTRISEAETAEIATSAQEPELRRAMQGLALSALLSRGILANNTSERGNLMKQSGEMLISATDGVIGLQAKIGGSQQRIEAVQTGNAARKSGLNVMIEQMTGADGYKTATDLKAVEMRLEALYISTTRLSRLSLVNYLR
ncbi:MAG: hypothetical protein GXP05_05975 [Alphaproteobacteria bacterium]|nr:hypothetical protein [Alphaproteobacteria bacterium]